MIFLAICTLYGLASNSYKKKDVIIGVKAGDASDECSLPIAQAHSKSVRLPNGRYINTKDFIRIRINGNCMKPREILNGEEWLVEKWDNNTKSLNCNLHPRDIMLLYIEDKHSYIIRELVSIKEDNRLKTKRYNDDGSDRFSKNDHRLEQVQGIVRYAI